jgi:hypothetical protein
MRCIRQDCVSWLKLDRANSVGGVPLCCLACYWVEDHPTEDNYEKEES